MIVGVHPLAGFDKVLHYKVPEPLRAAAAVGSLVRVPVGHAMRLGVIGGRRARRTTFPWTGSSPSPRSSIPSPR